ncbi:hypothetical protein RB653_001990 [Dictyostelium firmibasis]|uniref:Uncharacterized protein n=1 Tax=Dictyostelium firmibasis TaxID=79012 RepID=A0AAN7U793_9MYCE
MVKDYVSSLSKASVSILMFLSFLFILKISYIYIYEKKKSTAATVKKLIHFFVFIYILLIMILNYIQFEIYYYNPAIWTIFYKVIYNICGFLFTSSFILLLTYWIGMITDIFQIRKGAIFTKYTGPVFMVVQFTNFVIKLLTIISNARLFYLQTRLDLEKASIYYDFFVNIFVLIILVVFIVVNLYIFNKKVRRRIKIFTVIAAVVGSTFFVLTLIRVFIYYDSDRYSFATLILVSALCLEVIFVIYPIRIDVIKNKHINKFFGLFYIGYSKETKQETHSSYKKSQHPGANGATHVDGVHNEKETVISMDDLTSTTCTNTNTTNNKGGCDNTNNTNTTTSPLESQSLNTNSTPNTCADSIDNNINNSNLQQNQNESINPPNELNV